MFQQPEVSATFHQINRSEIVRCDLCDSSQRDLFTQGIDGHYYKCANCGLIYGIADADELSDFYDNTYHTRFAARVAAGTADQPKRSKHWHKKAKARLAGFEPYRKNGSFLEIGCSLGDFLNVVDESGWNAVGIEISDAAATYSRNRWGLDVRTGTIESVAPELPVGQFDVIWAANLLEHVVSPCRFLAKIEELLRPGGVLIASTLNFGSWAFQFSGRRWEYLHSAKEHRFVFSPEVLNRYCQLNGLQIEKVTTAGFRCVSKTRARSWYSPGIRLVEQAVSKLARLANQGHRIEFWAEKPEQAGNNGVLPSASEIRDLKSAA